MTVVETLEEAHRAQEQMEDLARLAHNVKLIVTQFEEAFLELQDYPEDLSESLCQLTAAADAVAAIAADWVQVSNTNFDPSAPHQRSSPMKRVLQWKGQEHGLHGYWSAYASRRVGGRYHVSKCGGSKNWTGFYEEISYRVEHEPVAHGNRRDLYVQSPLGYSTHAHTLPEAMALAQSDNDRVLAELAKRTACEGRPLLDVKEGA
jgi:hypothetical protein